MAERGHGKRRDFDALAIFDYANAKEAKLALDFYGGSLIVVQSELGPHDALADRLEVLLSSFVAILKDTISLAAAEKQTLESGTTSGGELAGRAKRV